MRENGESGQIRSEENFKSLCAEKIVGDGSDHQEQPIAYLIVQFDWATANE